MTLTITSTGAHVELDCAHGDIPSAPRTDARNEFSVAGTFTREHGGPVREGEVPDTRPALYAGSVRSSKMAMTIRLPETNDLIGSFDLTEGVTGRIVKCL